MSVCSLSLQFSTCYTLTIFKLVIISNYAVLGSLRGVGQEGHYKVFELNAKRKCEPEVLPPPLLVPSASRGQPVSSGFGCPYSANGAFSYPPPPPNNGVYPAGPPPGYTYPNPPPPGRSCRHLHYIHRHKTILHIAAQYYTF